MIINKIDVRVLKKCIRVTVNLLGKKHNIDILVKRENFKNKGWEYIENVDKHLDYISNNFITIYNSLQDVDFKHSSILPGELLLVDKSSDSYKDIYYEIDGEKFQTHFKISKNGKIITDISTDD